MKATLTLVLFLFCTPLHANADSPETVPFMKFFETVSNELNVPASVALAIAGVESGVKPWTLNIEGRGFHFASKDEALARAMEARRDGRSFDVGLMQINRWWLDRYGISLEAALDPLANIYLGCWILKREFERHKDLRAAIGAYHSPNPLRAGRYADQVMKALAGGPVNRDSAQAPKAAPAARAMRKTPPRPLAAAAPAAAHQSPGSEAAALKVGRNSHQSMKVRIK